MAKSTRRKFFYGLFGTLGIGVLGTWIFRRPILEQLSKGEFDTSLLTKAPSSPSDICVLTTKQTEGPFFFPSLDRKDIKEDRTGKDLNLKLQILDHPDCLPIEGAIVEIWHCDAEGEYSGYPPETSHDIWKSVMLLARKGKKVNGELHVEPVNEKQFLRGRQTTDAAGWVEFNTIFPGWYVGRVPHIHAKVFLPNDQEFATQLYFEDQLCNEIYTTISPYDKYGECPLQKDEDIVLGSFDKAEGLLVQIDPNSGNENALQATLKLGVA